MTHPAEAAPAKEPTGTLARRAGIVAAGTLVSRVLGLVRDAVIARCFALGVTDAFFVAFTIPNALRGLLAEGAVSAAFVPVFASVKEKDGDEAAKRYFANFLGVMGLVLVAVSALGIVGAPWLVQLYAGGYDAERLALTTSITRWVFPYIFFMGVAAIYSGALTAIKKFWVQSFTPALLNVAMIAAAFLAVPWMERHGYPGIMALAVGAIFGGFLQVVGQQPALLKSSFLPWPRFRVDAHVKRSFALLIPLLAGLGVYQLNIILSRNFASHLGEGAQSFLYYAQRLVELPQGLFAIAIAQASLPTLSALHARGATAELRENFDYSLRLSLFVAIPSTVILMVIAHPIIAVLFGGKELGAHGIAETARALVGMAPSVWAVSIVRTTIPIFYAHGDTRTPVWASTVNLATFVCLSLGLMGPLGHVGIALANSGAAVAQLGVLAFGVRRHVGPLVDKGVARSALRTIAASLALGASAYGVATVGQWDGHGAFVPSLAILGGAVLAGGVAFVVVARALGSAEVGEALAAIRRRAGPARKSS